MNNSSLPNVFGRNNHRPPSVSSHDSSISSSTSSQTLVPPPPGMFTANAQHRSQGPPAPLPQLHSLTRSPASSALSAYGQPYGTASTSPSTSSSVFQEPVGTSENGYPNSVISPTHLSPGLSSQKRPYRQRRKDPSCDACRERKVKCDATEMQSCSECTTRNVKCQFTKETNRRMSSIKYTQFASSPRGEEDTLTPLRRQVQDLQSQLAEAREELAELRSARREEDHMLNLPEIRPSTERKVELPVLRDFESVRQNIRSFGKGIFKVPPLYRQIIPPQLMIGAERQLPPKQLVDKLLHQYYYSIHRLYPILHWPSFYKQVEQMYANGSWEGVAQVWASVFYAVLACGTLQTPDSIDSEEGGRPTTDGVDFMRASTRCINTWTDEMSLDHTRCALLLCHYLTEMNLKSAGWTWLGSAVRIAQDIGLHIETGPWGMLEQEMRRRLWWCVYATDRFLSLENDRPPLINDEDCQVGWPCPIDDDLIHQRHVLKSSTSAAHTTMATVIPVVRFISQLNTTLKSRIVAPQTLRTYDEYFGSVMSTFPEIFQIKSMSYLEPHQLSVAFFLQAARFHLYRHNLSPACSLADRIDAMNRCHSVAKDTVRYVSRTLQTPPPSPSNPNGHIPDQDISRTGRWQSSVKSTALNASCAHLWRCTLILCFRGDFSLAATLVRVSAAIGDLRNMNMACGRHVKFFLETLLERWRTGRARPEQLERDEEMIAYLSGDLQGSTGTGWVWTGSETGYKLNANKASTEPAVKIERNTPSSVAGGYGGAARINGETVSPPPTPNRPTNDPATAMHAKRQTTDWGGWNTVEALLQELMDEHSRAQQSFPPQRDFPSRDAGCERERDDRTHQHYHEPSHNTGKRVQLAPPDALPARMPRTLATREQGTPQNELPPRPSSGASRISIANII